MLQRDGYPAGVPCFVDTAQPDPPAATDFYGGLFGWEFEDRMPPAAPGHFFAAKLGGREVAAIASQDGSPQAPAWSTYIAVDSADATAAAVWAAGGSVLTEPMDIFDAGRMAICADPQGAEFGIWQAGRHRGAQVVNAPGSWNWSNLHTRDVDGAQAFYGAVFGWQPTPVRFGPFEATMWRLPGYGESLERLDPGVRERHAGAGAPAGFSDAIGWLLEITPDAGDAPSQWAVTFAVDGTDAVAERACTLGGTIVTPAHDSGPTRVAELRDPQGATFSVSTYTPG
jgi:predicted enzyme related to lactoylglutathione lyase